MRLDGGAGCGARGRGFAATPPGGAGSPSAPTTWGCLQWLDAAWTKGGESRLDAVSAPGSTVPVDRKAAGGAPCGERASQRHVNAVRRWTAGCAARRSIPSHWGDERKKAPLRWGKLRRTRRRKETGWRSVG